MGKWAVLFIMGVFVTVAASAAADPADPCGPGLGTPLAALLQEDGWQCVRSQESIHVFARKTAGSGIREVAAVTVMPVPVSVVAGILADVERYPEFMPYVVQCRVDARNDGTLLVFQQLDFPFPISDRYYTVRMTLTDPRAPTGAFDLHWELAPPDPAHATGEGLGLAFNKGFWKLTALAGGRETMITYYIHTDPGGALPDWAVNMANTSAVPDVLDAVRQRAGALDP